MSRIEVMGCPVDALDMEQTIQEVERYIKQRKLCQHVVINVSKFVAMQKDPNLKMIINACDIINADGMPMVWVSKLFKQSLSSRVAGVDLFQALINLCHKKGYRPFFFGARECAVTTMVETFLHKYPDLEVAGYRNGYFSEHEEAEIAEMIKQSGADMLFVGFSSPMKEYFLNKWMPVMQVPFCMGVGGSFDIVAGKTKRAPLWMQNTGLEWLYRIIQEPKRMWKRYAQTNPVFILMVLRELVRRDIKQNDIKMNSPRHDIKPN